jgi:hypothetical protein
VIDRLRALLEDPYDPAVARAVVVLACVVTLGLTAVVGIGGAGSSEETTRTRPEGPTSSRSTPTPVGRPAVAHRREPRQDPQDLRGSASRRRATGELASHRALQHVPWHGDGVSIRLVGARGDRAVLLVRGPSVAADRRGWAAFLGRWKDDGNSYLPRLVVAADRADADRDRGGDR